MPWDNYRVSEFRLKVEGALSGDRDFFERVPEASRARIFSQRPKLPPDGLR